MGGERTCHDRCVDAAVEMFSQAASFPHSSRVEGLDEEENVSHPRSFSNSGRLQG